MLELKHQNLVFTSLYNALFKLDSAVERCSNEVLVSSERLGKGSGPKKLVKY